jgi:hypothetical protein
MKSPVWGVFSINLSITDLHATDDIFLCPGFPDFRTVADGRLLSISHNGCFEQFWVIQQNFFSEAAATDSVEIQFLIPSGFHVEQIVQTKRSDDTIEFTLAEAFVQDVNPLDFDFSFFKITLCLFGVKAFGFTEDLNIHGMILS